MGKPRQQSGEAPRAMWTVAGSLLSSTCEEVVPAMVGRAEGFWVPS